MQEFGWIGAFNSDNLFVSLFGLEPSEKNERVSQMGCGFLMKMPLEQGHWCRSLIGLVIPAFNEILQVWPHLVANF